MSQNRTEEITFTLNVDSEHAEEVKREVEKSLRVLAERFQLTEPDIFHLAPVPMSESSEDDVMIGLANDELSVPKSSPSSP